MATKRKAFVKIQCQSCKRVNYSTRKSKQLSSLSKGEKKLEMKKFCNWCVKHTEHKEGKK